MGKLFLCFRFPRFINARHFFSIPQQSNLDEPQRLIQRADTEDRHPPRAPNCHYARQENARFSFLDHVEHSFCPNRRSPTVSSLNRDHQVCKPSIRCTIHKLNTGGVCLCPSSTVSPLRRSSHQTLEVLAYLLPPKRPLASRRLQSRLSRAFLL